MQKKFKHVKLGYIAKESDDQYQCYNSLGDFFTHIPTQLIENSSDWVEVKEKEYPNDFRYDVERHGEFLMGGNSEKYADKLSTLDTLLCIRDEYNNIDDFVPNFDGNSFIPCICSENNNLKIDTWVSVNKPFAFKTKETAKLFLKNFQTQLEEIKELL